MKNVSQRRREILLYERKLINCALAVFCETRARANERASSRGDILNSILSLLGAAARVSNTYDDEKEKSYGDKRKV